MPASGLASFAFQARDAKAKAYTGRGSGDLRGADASTGAIIDNSASESSEEP
jgi:hypothetical protein